MHHMCKMQSHLESRLPMGTNHENGVFIVRSGLQEAIPARMAPAFRRPSSTSGSDKDFLHEFGTSDIPRTCGAAHSGSILSVADDQSENKLNKFPILSPLLK